MRYTPSVDEGERAYIDGLLGTSRTRAESAAEYRRMIAEVERAAAYKALTDAASEWSKQMVYGKPPVSGATFLMRRAAALGLTAGQEGKNE